MLIVIEIIAILLSPIIAVLISLWLQNRKEKKQQKLYIFSTLFAARFAPISEERVRALNMIDLVFYSDTHVRQLWREYFNLLCYEDYAISLNKQKQAYEKHLEMLHEMAKVLGFGNKISLLDITRVYYPTGLGQQSKLPADFLNVLTEMANNLKPTNKAKTKVN